VNIPAIAYKMEQGEWFEEQGIWTQEQGMPHDAVVVAAGVLQAAR